MKIPRGYLLTQNENKVCKLKKGFVWTQTPQVWFGRFFFFIKKRFSQAMMKSGYRKSNVDHTMFYKRRKGKVTILTIYVDDIIITSNDPEERVKLEKHLMGQFDIKDLGQLTYFWGLK